MLCNIDPPPPEVWVRVVCTVCDSDPIAADGSVCPQCEGECVIEIRQEAVTDEHRVIGFVEPR